MLAQQPTAIAAAADLAINETVWAVYMALAVYIGLCNVLHIVRKWAVVRKDLTRGPLFMHLAVVAAAMFFVVELSWNEAAILNCRKRQKKHHCGKSDCLAWKRVRNTLSAVSEALIILFYWFRSQTFYTNPLLSGLFISNENRARILNYLLLGFILAYPLAYTVYSQSDFWTHHHKYLYLFANGLCYENYTGGGYTPIGSVNMAGHVWLPEHKDTIPMIASTGFVVYQLLLHFCVIVPFLVPFLRYMTERHIPEVEALLKRCLYITGTLFLVNVLAWLMGHLLAPYMPVSKFMLDAIADVKITSGLILACVTMTNWRSVLGPWQRSSNLSRSIFANTGAYSTKSSRVPGSAARIWLCGAGQDSNSSIDS